jgi:hypothetical protein
MQLPNAFLRGKKHCEKLPLAKNRPITPTSLLKEKKVSA